ncbi:MAG: SUMF1/EgtB/PvdO family nonheme iron enzyme, partial [Polyangiaceae bacterium]
TTRPAAAADAGVTIVDASAAAIDAGTSLDATVGPADMRPVPAGTFTMGSDKGGEADEHPAHRVTLAGFWLDKTQVTNAAYLECVAAKKCRPYDAAVASRNHAGADALFRGPQKPVDGVGWADAKAYCAWRGKRLPREAEYERAIRDDDGRVYPWGNDPPTPERAVFGKPFGGGATEDVGSHPAGRGPFGHDDLAGNVWEWMEDEYDPVAYTRRGADHGEPGTCAEITKTLSDLRAKDEVGFTGSNPIPKTCEHVLRGGAYNYGPYGLRATNRVHHPGGYRLVMTGFRCAKDL